MIKEIFNKKHYYKYLLPFIKRLIYLLIGSIIKKRSFTSYYYHVGKSTGKNEKIDTFFTTSKGQKIPVFRDYRYSIKKGWAYFSCLDIFANLINKRLTSESDELFFKDTIGFRTLSRPLHEIEGHLITVLGRGGAEQLFIPESLKKPNSQVLAPSDKQIEHTIKGNLQNHRNHFSTLKSLGLFQFKPELKLLEIGYSSGGYSLFAFERMGFKPTGIDNYYGGIIDRDLLPIFLKNKIGSYVNFTKGDISQRTAFDNDSFDVIYSASVLEHILDLPSAFKEMYRLLKPGGIMMHGYNPFFCPNGGHALGILDSPWAHVRINKEDYSRYFIELRPHETETAIEWVSNALNPVSSNRMQSYLAQVGFKIKYWLESPAPSYQLRDMSLDIMRDCFNQHSGLTINDLVAQNVFFVALK